MHHLSMPLCFSTPVKEDIILHPKVTESLPVFNFKQRSKNSATGIKGHLEFIFGGREWELGRSMLSEWSVNPASVFTSLWGSEPFIELLSSAVLMG